ncbi:hypothetical protein [Jannaschia sp. 2305UL9-9]|uniref:hypothetical protein n=1 Tax=Jannaschia sp. 2305UL9-9 TaxID=3121638 RepID=UPI003526DE44
MVPSLKTFLTDEAGTITIDWVVLTAVLVGTGISVMSTLVTGIETASVSTAEGLRGHVVRSSFEGRMCRGGLSGLQAREAARVASGGGDAVDVEAWMAIYLGGLSDEAVAAQHRSLDEAMTFDGSWSRERTILTALECELVLRSLD